MAEKKTEVRTIMVRLMCDKCEGGEMKPTGLCLTSIPPQYPHKCDKCGAEVTVHRHTYPRTEYEEVTPNVMYTPTDVHTQNSQVIHQEKK